MKKLILFLLVCFIFENGYCQIKKKNQEVDIISHQVKMGESVRMLSKKYMVDPAEIYKLNDFAVNGISEGMVLKIPVPKKEVPIKEAEPVNEEIPGKTEEIVDSNPIKENTITKEVTNAPIKQKKAVTVVERATETNHTVLPKETMYSLSKKYNVSPDEIKMSNESVLKNGLKIGQVLKIPASKIEATNVPSVTKESTPTNEVANTKTNIATTESIIKHKVEPKETLYSLSKKYNVSVDVIKEQNAALLQNGLQIGQILLIKKQ